MRFYVLKGKVAEYDLTRRAALELLDNNRYTSRVINNTMYFRKRA